MSSAHYESRADVGGAFIWRPPTFQCWHKSLQMWSNQAFVVDGDKCDFSVSLVMNELNIPVHILTFKFWNFRRRIYHNEAVIDILSQDRLPSSEK